MSLIVRFVGTFLRKLVFTALDILRFLFWYGVGMVALVGIAGALRPLGDTVTVGLLVAFLILAPEFVHLLPGLTRRTRPSASPEVADPVPSLPAVPTPAHEPGATSIYRGRLTTLPPA